MNEADIGFVARLLGDPTRAAMCLSLVGGEARPAGELAARAGVSAQTASNHLARLIAGRILRVEQQGRWRYYRLAGAEVGHAVEALAVLAPPLADPVAGNGLDGAGHRLAEARTCYGHLAGRLGVMLADALVAQEWMEEDGRSYRLTPAGRAGPARARDRGAGAREAARGPAVPGLDGAPAARRRPGGHGSGEPGPRSRLGPAAPGLPGRGRHVGRARRAQEGLQCPLGGTVMITLSIRYTIDARKRQDFEQYARALGPIIPRCGGKVVGYWLPTKFAGPTNAALALIDFESLAAYEQYRERLAKDPDNVKAIQRAEESGCILVEDRAFLERV